MVKPVFVLKNKDRKMAALRDGNICLLLRKQTIILIRHCMVLSNC